MSADGETANTDSSPDYNPLRTDELFALTKDGYIVAHDIACQHEYIDEQLCSNCDQQTLRIMAQINRAFQGLHELAVICTNCRERFGFIFDISNDIYQIWLEGQLGENYVRQYDGPPRETDSDQMYFTS